VRGDEQSVSVTNWGKLFHARLRVVQQPRRLCFQVTNDVLLAPQERMTMNSMQTPIDGGRDVILRYTCNFK